MGLGHRLRSDDGLGSILAERLQAKLTENKRLRVVDGSTVPENYIKPAATFGPDLILVVDTLRAEEEPGTVRLVGFDELDLAGFSTHTFSPGLLADQLRERTGAELLVLGIVPENTAVGTELSPAISKTLDYLLEVFEKGTGDYD